MMKTFNNYQRRISQSAKDDAGRLAPVKESDKAM